MNQDVLNEITQRLPNATLEQLSHTSFWTDVKEFAQDQDWWYHRTEYLVRQSLVPQPGADWARAYKSLSENGFDFYGNHDLGSPLVLSILLQIGADPTERMERVMTLAVEGRNLETMKLLLSDPRTDPSAGDNEAIILACRKGDADIVQLLLSDPRLDLTSIVGHNCLLAAVDQEHTPVIRLLLADRRIDPSRHQNEAIEYAIQTGDPVIVALFLADNRVDPTDNEEGPMNTLGVAVSNGFTDVTRLLLEDGRINPSIFSYELITKAVGGGHIGMMTLLLEDPRIDPSGRYYSSALGMASKFSDIRLVELLFAQGRVNPTLNDNFALRMARRYRRTDVEKLLLTDPRVKELDDSERR